MFLRFVHKARGFLATKLTSARFLTAIKIGNLFIYFDFASVAAFTSLCLHFKL